VVSIWFIEIQFRLFCYPIKKTNEEERRKKRRISLARKGKVVSMWFIEMSV
jgi:hypothetical protein